LRLGEREHLVGVCILEVIGDTEPCFRIAPATDEPASDPCPASFLDPPITEVKATFQQSPVWFASGTEPQAGAPGF
jgi:hypothetical protein